MPRKTATQSSRKPSRKRAAKRGPSQSDVIRLTALQLAILASIERGPKREQYGSRIIQDVAADLGLDSMPLATVYTALRRLEHRGLLHSRWGAPGPDGGNRRRFYRADPVAAKALRTLARALSRRGGGRSRR